MSFFLLLLLLRLLRFAVIVIIVNYYQFHCRWGSDCVITMWLCVPDTEQWKTSPYDDDVRSSAATTKCPCYLNPQTN